MLECEQTSGMNMMQHGASVVQYFNDLKNHVLNGTPLELEWKLPEWATDNALWDNVFDFSTIEEYQMFHDCGKPYCRTVDAEGRQHFPDHASVSEAVWNAVNGSTDAARLMGMDMDVHLLKADGVPEFAKRPEAATLLLTGLAEIHSNAAMFGGLDSVSFKIKHKALVKRGKQILQQIKQSLQ